MQIIIDGNDLHESARRFGLSWLAVDPSQLIASLESEIRSILFQAGRSIATWSLYPPGATIVGDAALLDVQTVDVAKAVAGVASKLLAMLPNLGEACADVGKRIEQVATLQGNRQRSSDEDLVDDIHRAVRDWKMVVESTTTLDSTTGGVVSVGEEMLAAVETSLERFADAMETGKGNDAARAFGELAMLSEGILDEIAECVDPGGLTDSGSPTESRT